jgi:hypothetical protein
VKISKVISSPYLNTLNNKNTTILNVHQIHQQTNNNNNNTNYIYLNKNESKPYDDINRISIYNNPLQTTKNNQQSTITPIKTSNKEKPFPKFYTTITAKNSTYLTTTTANKDYYNYNQTAQQSYPSILTTVTSTNEQNNSNNNLFPNSNLQRYNNNKFTQNNSDNKNVYNRYHSFYNNPNNNSNINVNVNVKSPIEPDEDIVVDEEEELGHAETYANYMPSKCNQFGIEK